MQRAGIRVILDEFGTGVSSLTAIHQLSLDELKIDHSFVRCLSHSRPFVAIVNALLTMTRNLGMRVVADGVESTDQIQVLMSLGCDDMQGPFLSPAMSGDELTNWLRNGATLPLAA
jgi:EAL domain-containing protein (putative c-di-GMP-specific phosphodiesterase class I)